MELRKKKILTVAIGALLILVYVMIFLFSADNGENSSEISRKVTKWLVHLYYRIVGSGGSGQIVAGYVDSAEATIRKLAHLTEYMLVGFLSFSLAVMWMKSQLKGAMLVFVQLLFSASLDEFHQFFVPGRNASLKDIMIDIAGGVIGIGILFLMNCVFKLYKRRTGGR